MKKIGCFLCLFFVALGVISAQNNGVWVTEQTESGLNVIGYTGVGGAVTIPASINGIPVIGIETGIARDGIFTGKKVISVIISNGIAIIGDSAFRNGQLESVGIPESVTTIGWGAFARNQLTDIVIPNGVTSIGSWSFCENKLRNISFGSSVVSIGDGAFESNLLVNITLPDSLTHIGMEAFAMNKLRNLRIPEKVTNINIESSAFLDNPITTVTIPANVDVSHAAIQHGFNNDYDDGGRKAGTYTYSEGRWRSPSIVQPGNWITAKGKSGLIIVGYDGNDTEVAIPASIDGEPVVAVKGQERDYRNFGIFYGKNVTRVTIPSSVISIEDYAFASGTLTAVIISSGIASIGSGAFLENELTGIVIPESVTAIGSIAFAGNKLSSVTIPKNISSFGYNVFQNNPLRSVTIPANIIHSGIPIMLGDVGDTGTFQKFMTFYNSNGKRAGIYTFVNGGWNYEVR
jgi:hypothetical protein